jgi:hypothetical protein
MQSSSARTRRVTGSQGTRAQSPPEFNALSPSRGQIHRLRNPHPYHRRVQCLGRAAADRAGKRQDFTRPAQSMRAHALSNTPGSPGGPNLPPMRACARTQPSAAAGPRCRRDSSACSTAARAAWSPSIAPMRGLYEALGLDIVRGIARRPRADETSGLSSRFQPAAQLDHRRRVPLAAGRARYLASV